MPKPLELRKVIRRLRDYGVIYVTGRGRHPKFYDPETKKSYPVKSHGKKTLILILCAGGHDKEIRSAGRCL